MNSFLTTPAISAGLGLLLFGCTTHDATLRERAVSFVRYETLNIDGTPVREYVLQRTALVIAGRDVEIEKWRKEPDQYEVRSEGMIRFGSATAIDRRGYFLTAAHCLTKGPVYLLVPTPDGRSRACPARIVWRGNPSFGRLDLALLHAPSARASVFAWAREFGDGDAVIGVGFDSKFDDNEGYQTTMVPFGGVISRVSPGRHGELPWQLIRHTAPLHRGDSGGPLIDSHGRLLGINVALESFFVSSRDATTPRSQAIRPNLPWLRALIEKDSVRDGGRRSQNEGRGRRR